MAAEYVLQEDGTSKVTLEDGSGFVLLESSTAGGDVTVTVPAAAVTIAANAPTVATGVTVAAPAASIEVTAYAPSVQASEGTEETARSGGWLSLPDYTRGRDEYVRRQRIALGILPPEQIAQVAVIPEAVAQSAKVVALRTRGVRMSTQQREADLRAEVERTQAWKDDYAAALYAELYRIEKQRRDDDLIVALLAA